MKLKDIKLYALGSLLVVIALFGTVELSTRIISWLTGKGFLLSLHEYEPYDRYVERIYQWHPFTGITFRPNATFKGSHPNQANQSQIIVDHHGFLSDGQTITTEKPADEIRIAAIGASTAANLNLSYSENWPGYLGNLIQKTFPNKKVRVINAGVPGFDTAQSVGNLALRVMPFQPDIVIIYHAYNDLKTINQKVKFRPDYSHIHTKPWGHMVKPNIFIRCLNHSMIYVRARTEYRAYKKEKLMLKKIDKLFSGENRLNYIPKEAKKTFEQHLRILVSIAQSGGAHVILSSFATLHDPNSSAGESKRYKQTSTLKKTELLLAGYFVSGLTLDALFKGINQYNEALRIIAVDNHCGWVDNASMIPHEERYFVDRVHFSPAGAALMAKNLFPVVMQEFKKM